MVKLALTKPQENSYCLYIILDVPYFQELDYLRKTVFRLAKMSYKQYNVKGLGWGMPLNEGLNPA